jgi:hypothetical protein
MRRARRFGRVARFPLARCRARGENGPRAFDRRARPHDTTFSAVPLATAEIPFVPSRRVAMADSPLPARRARLNVECLEDRTVPAFLTRPGGTINVNGVRQAAVGLSIAVGNLTGTQGDSFSPPGQIRNEVVTGTGPGTPARVNVFDSNGLNSAGQGLPIISFDPYPGFNFTGGINVAVGDVLGDAGMEIIVTPASNAPGFVTVYDVSGNLLSAFLATPAAYTGGLTVAVGNVLGGIAAGGFAGGTTSGQFKQEIIVGTATQFDFVGVFDAFGGMQRSFLAFGGARTGVNLAAATIDSTRVPGYVVGSGDPDTNAFDEIIVGANSVAPAVAIYSVDTPTNVLRQFFFAFDQNSGRGVTVAAGSTDGIRGAEIYTNLLGTSLLRVHNGETAFLRGELAVFPADYTGVLNIAVGQLDAAFFGFGGFYDPRDDDAFPAMMGDSGNPDFLNLDLAIVTGDGPAFQRPRFFRGSLFLNIAAPFNGP